MTAGAMTDGDIIAALGWRACEGDHKCRVHDSSWCPISRFPDPDVCWRGYYMLEGARAALERAP